MMQNSSFYAGSERQNTKDLLRTHSNIQVIDKFIANGSPTQLAAGYSEVPCTSSLDKLRREILNENDEDSDDLIDMIRRCKGPLQNFIRHLDIVSFCAILFKDEQLDVFERWRSNCKFRRGYIDATGNIVRKLNESGPVLLHHVLLISIRIADDRATVPFTVAEMITESQTMFTIKHFLEFVHHAIIKKNHRSGLMFHEIVTDKSFANIGAILMTFNRMTLTEYLRFCWNTLQVQDKTQQKKALKEITVVRLCSSHTCKTMRDLISQFFKDTSTANTVCAIIGNMFNINDFEMLMKYCEGFLFSLHSRFVGPKMTASRAETMMILRQALGSGKFPDSFKIEGDVENDRERFYDPVADETENNVIYKNSDTYKRLQHFLVTSDRDTEGIANLFYNEEFGQKFLKNHLSYIFLWGNLMTAIRNPCASRANNGAIEQSFKMKKREAREHSHEIGQFGKVKPGRYMAFMSDKIDLRVKKILLGIPAKAGNRVNTRARSDCETEQDVFNASEQYRKRNRSESRRASFFPVAVQKRRSSSQPASSSSSNQASSQSSTQDP